MVQDTVPSASSTSRPIEWAELRVYFYYMERPLEGRIAVITGVGRRSGIGYAIASALAQAGAHIFYTYWKAYDLSLELEGADDNATLFAEDFEAHTVQALSSELDLSADDAPEKLLALVRTKMGEPSILIHNACVSQRIPFFALDADALQAHFAVNVKATTLLTKEFVAGCPEGSSIIHMTSGQGLGAMDVDELAYTITKASIDMLVAQLAPMLTHRGVTINALDPGPTDTGWMHEDLKQEIANAGGRINRPEDIGQLVINLLTHDLSISSGEVIRAPRSI